MFFGRGDVEEQQLAKLEQEQQHPLGQQQQQQLLEEVQQEVQEGVQHHRGRGGRVFFVIDIVPTSASGPGSVAAG